MSLSRRRFLTVVGGIALASRLPVSYVARALAGATPEELAAVAAAAAEHTTLAATLGPGAPVNSLGYRPVVTRPGEAHLVRADLAPPQAGRETRRASLVNFSHLTDQHIIDVQSCSRVEFLDRYNDSSCNSFMPFSAAHRPHEAASVRLNDAMLRQLRTVAASPVTGVPIQAAICTGDNTDNQQANELALFLGVMDGGWVAPNSGDTTRYEGVQASGSLHYWHPDPAVADLYKTGYGFPARPGFLEAALAPFQAAGAGVPWYTCYGNHDGLAQGNTPPNPAIEAISTGPLKAVGLPPGTNPCTPMAGLGSASAPAVPVAGDPERRYLRRREWIDGHLKSPTAPAGHGLTPANLAAGTLYYATDVGAVRFVVLDTVNPGGFSEGSIGAQQLAWLDARLAEAEQQQKLVLLFSHHGLRSLNNPFDEPDPLDPSGGDLPRKRAADVFAVVSRYSCVIAWVNGHTHSNVIAPRGTFWEVGTAAHIDWPPQSRLVEVVDNGDGTLSIFATLVDLEADEITGFARELMANDPQVGFSHGTGRPEDRNCELLITHPFRPA